MSLLERVIYIEYGDNLPDTIIFIIGAPGVVKALKWRVCSGILSGGWIKCFICCLVGDNETKPAVIDGALLLVWLLLIGRIRYIGKRAGVGAGVGGGWGWGRGHGEGVGLGLGSGLGWGWCWYLTTMSSETRPQIAKLFALIPCMHYLGIVYSQKKSNYMNSANTK